jgi:tetratricopeptide (TPR) repeat protein
MDRALAQDLTRREANLYRLLANVELGNATAADADIDRVDSAYPDLFEANLGIVRAELLNERNGNAFLALENTIELAETDEQKALAYYWAATVYEARSELRDAAEYWELLLELPEDSMTGEMRETAEERLLDIRPPTPTSSPTRTPTPTRTVTATPTRTSPVTPTRTP